jgi:hypothetical protein
VASGRTCTAGDLPIHVCVHFHPFQSGTEPATDPTGVAVGKIELSTSAPAAPGTPSTQPGDERIGVSWSAPSGGADRYRIQATPLDPVADPRGMRTREITGTSGDIEGLVNDVTYAVEVVALSIAGNPSPPSPRTNETPRVVADFWDTYRAAEGAEQGGCGFPGAGALGLLGLAALLPRLFTSARARRRS